MIAKRLTQHTGATILDPSADHAWGESSKSEVEVTPRLERTSVAFPPVESAT